MHDVVITFALVFVIALITSTIIGYIDYKKHKDKNKFFKDTFTGILAAFILSNFAYIVINKNFAFAAAILGAYKGKESIDFVFNYISSNKDDISSQEDDKKDKNISETKKGNFMTLMKQFYIITEEECELVLEEQMKQKILLEQGKRESVQKVGEIFLEMQVANEDKLFIKSAIDIVLEVQRTGDYDKALSEMYALKKLVGRAI